MTGPARRIGFAYNPTSEPALDLRERAEGWCRMRGLDAWAHPAGEYAALAASMPGTDAVVVLGGDGTFLRAARVAAEVDIPLLGVNVGKVGFLSKVEAEEMLRVLGQVAAGDYRLELRMALEGIILRSGVRTDPPERYVALNDVVVARGSLARVCRLDVSVDGIHLATYVADGLVVASPTGSTGYSFSVGGPIVDPESRNLIVSPIAGYLSAIRSIVVEPAKVVACRVVAAHEALVSVDGREDVTIAVGDTVEVRALERPVRFIVPTGSLPFWDLLRRKAELLPS